VRFLGRRMRVGVAESEAGAFGRVFEPRGRPRLRGAGEVSVAAPAAAEGVAAAG
jgi:hypothetical protein